MAEKRQCATMLFLNPQGEILLLLRDNKPGIPYPNTWDLPGGHLEEGETPTECIRREMSEELPGLNLGNFRAYKVMEFADHVNHIFWTRIDTRSLRSRTCVLSKSTLSNPCLTSVLCGAVA